MPAVVVAVGVDARGNVHGLSRPFELRVRSLGGLPSGSQRGIHSQVDRTSSHDSSRSSQLGLQLPSSVHPCGSVPTSGPPFLDGISISCSVLLTSQVGRVSSHNTSRSGQSHLHSWVRGGISSTPLSPCGTSPCGRMGSRSPSVGRHLRFRDSTSALRSPFCGSALYGCTLTSCLLLRLQQALIVRLVLRGELVAST